MKSKMTKVAILAACCTLFQLGGLINTCNKVLDVVATPITVAGALETLGWVDLNPNH